MQRLIDFRALDPKYNTPPHHKVQGLLQKSVRARDRGYKETVPDEYSEGLAEDVTACPRSERAQATPQPIMDRGRWDEIPLKAKEWGI